MEHNHNLTIGLLWGITLSIPLWISLIGWIQLLIMALRIIQRMKFI